jgi:hypothetical protein
MSTPSTPSRGSVDCRLGLVAAPNGEWANDEAEPARYLLCLGKASNLGWAGGVKHQPYSRRPRHSILEKLDALAGQPFETLHHRYAGDVAARPRQTGDQAGADRVTGHQDHWNGRGHSLEGADRKVTNCDQDIRLELHQLGGEVGQEVVAALAEAIVDDDVLPLDIAELHQPLAKSRHLGRISGRSSSPDPADPRDLRRLLRAPIERPRATCAANEECRRAQLEQISTAALPVPVPGLHCASSKPRRTREA